MSYDKPKTKKDPTPRGSVISNNNGVVKKKQSSTVLRHKQSSGRKEIKKGTETPKGKS